MSKHTIKHIAFTYYPVSNLALARQFYENTLGLTPAETFGDYGQEYYLGDGTFALLVPPTEEPIFFHNRGTSIAFEVENLEDSLAEMRRQNVPVLWGPTDTPVCKMAAITDPDENVLILHQLNRA